MKRLVSAALWPLAILADWIGQAIDEATDFFDLDGDE